MTAKCRTLYDAVFIQTRNNYPGFKPKKCVVDFETALYSSIQFTFECEMQGCYFHYRQALWRKWVHFGLRRNETLLFWLQQLMSLPLLPAEKIPEGFQYLSPSKLQNTDDNVLKFYNYIESFWMGKIPYQLLSVHGCVRRTNSEVECFHWGLLRKIQVRHPNFWIFLLRIKTIAKSYFLEMNDLATGSETRKRRSKFSKTVDAAIKDAEERLRDAPLTLPEFLKRVSRANEKSFHKLETLDDKDQDENEDPTESGDDNLECSEDDEENYDMCAGCDQNNICFLVQPCGHMLCFYCGKLSCCKMCGQKINGSVFVTFDDAASS